MFSFFQNDRLPYRPRIFPRPASFTPSRRLTGLARPHSILAEEQAVVERHGSTSHIPETAHSPHPGSWVGVDRLPGRVGWFAGARHHPQARRCAFSVSEPRVRLQDCRAMLAAVLLLQPPGENGLGAGQPRSATAHGGMACAPAARPGTEIILLLGSLCLLGCRDKTFAPDCGRAGSGWVIGMQAQQCCGLGSHWLGGEPASLPPPRVAWRYDASPVRWLDNPCFQAVSVVLVPPAPPPRG
jgi:hypothetical protein